MKKIKWNLKNFFNNDPSVEVSEKDGIRYLHLSTTTVQSAMKIKEPSSLVLSYTQSMMFFLVFNLMPSKILCIGLGGGSLPKYLLKKITRTSIIVIENNEKVINIARNLFCVPENFDRFKVIHGHGEHWVNRNIQETFDVLLIDGYDGFSQAKELETLEFYKNCYDKLSSIGMLVVNLWSNKPSYLENLRKIKFFFKYSIKVPSKTSKNMIIIGFKERPHVSQWNDLDLIVKRLDLNHDISFSCMLKSLKKVNSCDKKGIVF